MQFAFFLSVFLCVPLCPLWFNNSAHAVETESLKSKELAQQRAVEMAREIVSTILDLQLRQLEENGLSHMTIYGDIKAMRGEIDALVQSEMPEVVELLVKAQKGSRAERERHFTDVRAKVREIIVALTTERQKLLRRLRIAKVEAQIRQIIERQSAVRDATILLVSRAERERESAALAARHDQRDIAALYKGLENALSDVGTWGGDVGAEALAGLGHLREDRIFQEIDMAIEALDGGGKFRNASESERFDSAAKSQTKVIDALARLLPRIAQTRDRVEGDRLAALERVRAMIEKQKQLRAETKSAKLDDKKVAQLTKEQSAIRGELGKLGEQVKEVPDTTPFVRQAEAASARAEEKVFDSRQEDAVAEQGRVLSNLQAIEERLKDADDFLNSDKTAEQLARQAADLEKIRDDVQAIQKAQERVSAAAQSQPELAQRGEERIAAALSKADEGRDAPASVKARLDTAEMAAKEAAAALDGAKEPSPATREAVKKADEAVELAAAEVAAALDNTKRKAQGVKIGELARAAEALERAAAAEREIVSEATAAAKNDGLKKNQAERLEAEHDHVEKVADKIAEGVKNSAAEVGQQLAEAKKPIGAAAKELSAATSQPGEKSKSAAKEAAQQTMKAAESLEKAAEGLRKEIGAAANALRKEGGRQLTKLGDTRQPIEQSLDSDPIQADKIEGLARQAAKVDPAATSALRAAQKTAQSAAKAAKKPEQSVQAAADVQADILRAAADIAAREQQVNRDLAAAKSIADAALKQQSARDKITKQSKALTESSEAQSGGSQSPQGQPSESKSPSASSAAAGQKPSTAPSAAAKQAAEALQAAQDQFAEAQRAVGQAAVEVSGQEQVANPPIRQALDEASQLGQAAGEQIAPGDASQSGGQAQAESGQGQGQSKASEQGQDKDGGQGRGQGQGQGRAGPQGQGGGSAGASSLGTGFIPRSPDVTAQMIAGSAASAALGEALGTGQGQGQGQGEGPGKGSQSGSPAASKQGGTSAHSKGGGASTGGKDRQNQIGNDSPLEQLPTAEGRDSRTATANSDTAAQPGRFRAPPWFSRLPPEQQQALRANALRRAPRGYEERLKRYFENIDH